MSVASASASGSELHSANADARAIADCVRSRGQRSQPRLCVDGPGIDRGERARQTFVQLADGVWPYHALTCAAAQRASRFV